MAHGWAKWSRGPEKFGELLHQIGVPLSGFTAWVVTFFEFFGGMAILARILVALVSRSIGFRSGQVVAKVGSARLKRVAGVRLVR